MKTNFNPSVSLKSVFVSMITLLTVVSTSALSPVNVKNKVDITPAPLKSVYYQSVKAKTSEKSVMLDWNTVAEFGNSHFEVERSFDMNQYKTVAIILDGFTTTGTGKRYAFKEDIIVVKNNKTAYYRLKQFDVFGNISYSDVIKVQP